MLSLTTKFGGFFAAAAMSIGLAGAASAATVSFGALPATSVANPLATSKSATGVVENNAANIVGVRLGPWAPASTNVFTSVSINRFAEYDFRTILNNANVVLKSLTFVWGTPDEFNSVEFWRNGGLVDTLPGFGNGTNIVMPTATVTNILGGGFDTVRFKSSGVAFEYGSISVAEIPVPAAGLMLLTALGGVAVLRRRKSA